MRSPEAEAKARYNTPTYKCWTAMKGRCLNPNNARYPSYGGRGIAVCERWLVFDNFLADMSARPDGMSLDRIDNDGHYEPGNCRWATPQEQMNNKRDSHYLEHNGQRKTITEWARETGMTRDALSTRIRRGWPVALALTKDIKTKGGVKPSIDHTQVRMYDGDRELFEAAFRASECRTLAEWIRNTLREAANAELRRSAA